MLTNTVPSRNPNRSRSSKSTRCGISYTARPTASGSGRLIPTEALFRKDKSNLKFLGRVTAGAAGQAGDEAESEALSEGSAGPGDMAFRSDGRVVGVGELGIGQVFG